MSLSVLILLRSVAQRLAVSAATASIATIYDVHCPREGRFYLQKTREKVFSTARVMWSPKLRVLVSALQSQLFPMNAPSTNITSL